MANEVRPRVAVVTPVHNRVAHTLRYLESFQGVAYDDVELIIVDDGSTDDTAAAVSARFPSVTLLHGDGSLWWSGGTNLGVRHALEFGAAYVLTLNNDVTVAPDFLERLVATARERGRALVGASVRYAHDSERVWYCGARFDHESGDITLVAGDASSFSGVRSVEMMTGMGMLIPASALREIGLFDEAVFPQYFADSDLSLRARAAGYDLVVDPAAVIFADVGASWTSEQFQRLPPRFARDVLFSVRSQYDVRTRYRFYRRHWRPGWRSALVRLYTRTVARILIRFYVRKVARCISYRGWATRGERANGGPQSR